MRTNPGKSPSSVEGRTGIQCLVAVARFHGIDVAEPQIVHAQALDAAEVSLETIAGIARELGLKARIKKTDWEGLPRIGQAFPAILFTQSGQFIVLSGFRQTPDGGREVAVRDPQSGSPDFEFLDAAALARRWDGRVLLLQRRYAASDERRPFGLCWFLPEMLRQRSVFRDVGLAALVLHVLALATPIFFQLMIDKVVVHQGTSTLIVLTIGILMVIAADGLLGYLRSRLLLHATSKIDIRVATTVFRHLLSLPLRFFEKVPAGILVRHMQQDHTIREFLTGRLFLTLLDASALIVFVPVLFFYSAWLGLVVLAFSALLALVIGLVSGPFRTRLKALYTAEAERQALLVETIHGIATVKSLALEPVQRRNWERRSANSVQRHLEVGRISAGAGAISGTLDKLMSVAIICVGVLLVFAHRLTVGELIAFQMLAGRVSGPLVQLVGLINSYQEAALSVRMLGEVMNTAPETRLDQGLQPDLRGAVHFDEVSFGYEGAASPALDGVSFSAPAGSVIGVVGRSGSGKSTLVRLIQGLEQAQRGLIRLDGYDLREIDKVHLRAQIGVVPQETFLFHGTIRENIAVAKPDASFAEIVEAARTAWWNCVRQQRVWCRR